MTKSPWRSMRTAPNNERIVACLDPATALAHRAAHPVTEIEWLDDEACWWNGGCVRYSAHEFLGWVPFPPTVSRDRRYA